MRIKLLIPLYLLSFCIGRTAHAQNDQQAQTFGNVFMFGCAVTESMRATQVTSQSVGVMATDIDHLYKPWILKDKTISKILLGVKLNPKLTNYNLSPIKSFSKSFTAYRIADGSDAIVIAMGINKDNVNDYRYHVVLNDSAEVIPWSIPRLDKNYGASKAYGFIGKFNYPDKQALVEVVNIKDYQIRDGVIFDWRKNIKPISTNLLIYAPHGMHRVIKKAEDSLANAPEPYQTKHDPVTNEITEVSFEQGAISQLQLILREHPGIYYAVSLKNDDNSEYPFWTAGEGDGLQPTFTFSHLPSLPGKYEIIVSPQISGGVNIKGQELRIAVVIKPAPFLEEKASIKQMLPYIIGAIIFIVLIFGGYYRRNKVKLLRAAQEKKVASLTLKSIRAQLNPHFMFNALTSIQNLMNKNDTKSANHYLSRFASLTRKVLNTSEQDMISLEDEVKILDDYLLMEQLRFNFKYELKVNERINQSNTEVPAMLLQPFVENAVKHGVANILEQGIIKVSIEQQNKDLVMLIADNGAGFVKENESGKQSFGLKLSEERIKLFNEIYTGQPAKLIINTGATGTTVTVTLTNWM